YQLPVIVPRHNLVSKGKWHAARPCRPERLRAGRTVRRYEDEIHTDGETTMTMNLHTPTTAPKAAPATSVSPLEQSGSPKTKFPEIKTVKTAVVKLISDIEGNLDQRLAYREAVEGLCQEAANRITQCMHSRSTGQTLRDLRELLSVTLDTIIVVEFEGEQTRLNYGGRSAEDVIAMLKALHLEGRKAWLEVE
ncbi:hypothetical protein ACYKPQ_004736, partial [Salmonella enterica subsp. enterica serovar Newport]